MAKKVKKKELGKGIRAIFSSMEQEKSDSSVKEKAVKELNSTIAMIPLEMIEVNPYQPRTEFDREALDELTDSIIKHGLIQPITLRKLNSDQFQIISGERRFRASQAAGLEEVPAYIRVADDQAMLEMALVENIQRKDLNPIEIAISYQRLMNECDLTHEQLSSRVSKNRSTVTNYIRLLKLPPEVQKSVKEDKISMGHARAIAGVDNTNLQLKFLRDVIKDKLSVRDLEKLIRSYNNSDPKKSTRKSPPNPMVTQIKEQLIDKFNAKVDISRSDKGKGKISFFFNSDEEFNDILDLLKDA